MYDWIYENGDNNWAPVCGKSPIFHFYFTAPKGSL